MKEMLKIWLLIIMFLGTILIFSGCGKNNTNENAENMNGIDEATWTTQVVSSGDYYYYVEDKSEIRGIRKDKLDYNLIYKPEYSTNLLIDYENYSVYEDDIYFIETDRDSNDNYIFRIMKVDVNGKKEVEVVSTKTLMYDRKSSNMYNACVTSKGLYYSIGNKMYMYDFEKQEEIEYNVEFTDENLIPNFTVSEDGSIYYAKGKNASKTLYKLTTDKLEVLKKDIGYIQQYYFVKNGDRLYGSGATLGMDGNSLEYIDLNNYEIKSIETEYKGNVFNKGNSIYLLSGDKIYKLVNDKWEEHIKLNNYQYDGTLGGAVNGRIIFDDSVMANLGVFRTKFFNYKDGVFYKWNDINEKNAKKDTYLLNKIESTSVKNVGYGNEADNVHSYIYRSQDKVIAWTEKGNGSVYTNEWDVFCTNEEILSALGQGVDVITLDNINIYDGYLYGLVCTENLSDHKMAGYCIIKKNCNGTEAASIISKIPSDVVISDIQFFENYIYAIGTNSIYSIDCINNTTTEIYKKKYGKIKTSNTSDWYVNVAFLDKEVLVYDNITGHIFVADYAGNTKGLQVFDRSYNISLEDCTFEDGYLVVSGTKININTGLVVK